MQDYPELILSSGKRDLVINPPWMNASGFLGFADEARHHLDWSQMGAFVTNTISLEPRSPSNPPRLLQFQGGFLMHSGHPNPGLSKAIDRYHRTWREMPLPVIVNLLAFSPDEASRMVQSLEGIENVMAVELMVRSEPVGEQEALIAAACAGELPVIVRVPMTASTGLVQRVEQAGAQAISLGPARGALPGPNGEMVSGRLYGQGTFALALETVHQWQSTMELPLIGGGGLCSQTNIQALFKIGASGVQLDTLLWGKICSGDSAEIQSGG